MTVGRPPGSRSAAACRALGDNVLSAPRKRECTVVCRLLSHLAPPCIVRGACCRRVSFVRKGSFGGICVFFGVDLNLPQKTDKSPQNPNIHC